MPNGVLTCNMRNEFATDSATPSEFTVESTFLPEINNVQLINIHKLFLKYLWLVR